ncbi:MAG: MarR family transcriptional regulator [Gammaproteobacteria bacterium]|nr:MarR family transcriptional regulator [Gammaproteobacteria bacterium]MCW8987518.1 MarR family transcriptional regulator [Gammaproteobacteria bacterium]MCW9032315.1 MarR family transcriptional regulator [Gammaproteobacteria bacterium]
MESLHIIQLLEATQIFEKKLNLALMYSGLRIPQFRAMLFLEKSGKITVSDLSRYLNVTRATMSVLSNDLIKADIVESIKNPKDKRSFYMKLTESGLRRLELAKREVALVQDRISSEFTPETIALLNQIVTSIISKN